jgi:hypothetical protein
LAAEQPETWPITIDDAEESTVSVAEDRP